MMVIMIVPRFQTETDSLFGYVQTKTHPKLVTLFLVVHVASIVKK
jgi:hypothetical protein